MTERYWYERDYLKKHGCWPPGWSLTNSEWYEWQGKLEADRAERDRLEELEYQMARELEARAVRDALGGLPFAMPVTVEYTQMVVDTSCPLFPSMRQQRRNGRGR